MKRGLLIACLVLIFGALLVLAEQVYRLKERIDQLEARPPALIEPPRVLPNKQTGEGVWKRPKPRAEDRWPPEHGPGRASEGGHPLNPGRVEPGESKR